MDDTTRIADRIAGAIMDVIERRGGIIRADLATAAEAELRLAEWRGGAGPAPAAAPAPWIGLGAALAAFEVRRNAREPAGTTS